MSLEEQLKHWVEVLNEDKTIVRSAVKDHKYHELMSTMDNSVTCLVDNSNEIFTTISNAFIKCNSNNINSMVFTVSDTIIPDNIYESLCTKIINVVNSVKLGMNGSKQIYSTLMSHLDPTFVTHFFNTYLCNDIEKNKLTPETLDFIVNCYFYKIIDTPLFNKFIYKSDPRNIISTLVQYKSKFDKQDLKNYISEIKEKFPNDIKFGLNKFNLMNLEKFV